MGGRPIGYQPLRAGLHRPWVGPRTVNINHKETTINNFGGGFFPMGAYGYYDTGLSKGEKWGIALGAIGALGGAIASAFLPQKADGKGDVETPAQDGLTDGEKQWMEDTKNQLSQMQKSLDQLTEENAKLKAQAQEIQNLRAASEAYQQEHNGKVEEVKQESDVATFNVKATYNKDTKQYEGHTGYNIVAKMYTSPDGKPLTDAVIRGICKEIFGDKALPTGEIQLPKKVPYNNVTYTWNENIKNPEEQVKPVSYNLAQHDTYKSETKQVGSKWAVYIDGKQVGDLHDTKDLADEALKTELEKLNEDKS